jgi:putative ABC transport system permease protein
MSREDVLFGLSPGQKLKKIREMKGYTQQALAVEFLKEIEGPAYDTSLDIYRNLSNEERERRELSISAVILVWESGRRRVSYYKNIFYRLLGTTEEEIYGKRGTSYNLGEAYTIVGVAEGDENIVYIPIESLQEVPIGSYTKLKVKCRSTDVIEPVRQAIDTLGLTASSISETIDQANKVFQAIQLILMVFGMIALIVSAIGMFNTMTITLLERTEEIGIMKAIGASKKDISLMFVMESTLMGFLGALGGVIIGFLNGVVINILINAIATRFGGEAVSLFYSPLWFIMTVVGFGAFVGFMTGVFPARKASRIDALDALRYK